MSGFRPLSSHRVVLFEGAMIVALSGWFLGTWLVFTARLNMLPPGTRSYQFALYRTDDSLGLALAIALSAFALLMLRRFRPVLMLLGVIVLVLVLHWRYPMMLEMQPATTVLIALAAFWAAVGARRMWPVVILALVASAIAILPMALILQNLQAATTTSIQPGLTFFAGLAQALVITGIGLSAAALLRRSRALTRRLERSNEELRAQRQAVAQAAVTDERLRIARELHDVVAHHVTAMTVHAGAVRTIVATNPDAVGEPLQQIERSGRAAAVAELHRLLGFLRGGEAQDRTPAPGLENLAALTTSFPSLRVDAEVTGDAATVSPMLGLSIYRIVQEALTNVAKHSTARSAVVRIEIAEDVSVVVRDPGAPNHSGIGTGHGTLGLRERVALHRGRIDLGPIPGGGWQVVARLALQGSTS